MKGRSLYVCPSKEGLIGHCTSANEAYIGRKGGSEICPRLGKKGRAKTISAGGRGILSKTTEEKKKGQSRLK